MAIKTFMKLRGSRELKIRSNRNLDSLLLEMIELYCSTQFLYKACNKYLEYTSEHITI